MMRLFAEGHIGWMVILVMGFATLSHAESTEKSSSIELVKKETRELLQALKSYTSEQQKEALNQTKEVMDRLDTQIDALEKRIDENWDKMDQAARQEARANLNELRRHRLEVAEWYGQLKGSSGKAWAHVKQGFSDAYTTLSEALEKAEKEFESDK